jgi:hypothetical protein
MPYLFGVHLPPPDTFIEKTTWWGCGQHIPMVMDPVPQSERCTCNPKTTIDSKEYPPKSGEGKASSTGDYGSTRTRKVAKLTGTG